MVALVDHYKVVKETAMKPALLCDKRYNCNGR